MTCNDATEFVSALCDGETIPREAAEHIGDCKACQAVLTEYLEIGAELRRVASLAAPEALRPLILEKKHGTMRAIWRKGWETMRIPRFAFATLLVGIVALSLSLALAKVHAHSEGNVLMLTVAPNHGPSLRCPLSTVDKKNSECGWGEGVGSGYLNYSIRLLSKEDDRVRLGVRAEFDPREDHVSSAVSKDLPEKQYLFEPGETMQIDVAGFGPLAVTGEWMAYMPYFGELNLEDNLEPKPGQLRLISPVLLKAKEVVVDFGGTSVTGEQKDDMAWLYVPGDGLYELSLSPLAGGVEGHAENNRLSFRIDGQSYLLLTGAPIARGDQVWILHTANVKPSDPHFSHAAVGMEEINHLIPREKTKN
jgi:hypothetical protein